MKFTINRLIELAGYAHTFPVDECGELYPPSPYYNFFYLLAKEYSNYVTVSVVLGVCGGGDCYHFCKGNPNGTVIGVDFSWDHPKQIKNIVKNYPYFNFMLNDTTEAAKVIKDLYTPVDFLFIDSAHTYKQSMKEFNTYKPLMREGGVICMDDFHRKEMDGVWEALPEPKVRLDHLHPGSTEGGFAAVIV